MIKHIGYKLYNNMGNLSDLEILPMGNRQNLQKYIPVHAGRTWVKLPTPKWKAGRAAFRFT